MELHSSIIRFEIAVPEARHVLPGHDKAHITTIIINDHIDIRIKTKNERFFDLLQLR